MRPGLSRRAIAQRLAGDPRDAVLSLQSAAETFLRGLLRLLLVDRGESAAVIASAARQTLESLLKTALPPLVGGDWVGPRAAVTVYRRDLYDLRNRMIHSGMEPHWRDVPPAFDAYDGLIRFIERQLLTRWKRFPRTLAGLWEPWAGGTLGLPPAARPVVQKLVAQQPPYWLPTPPADG